MSTVIKKRTKKIICEEDDEEFKTPNKRQSIENEEQNINFIFESKNRGITIQKENSLQDENKNNLTDPSFFFGQQKYSLDRTPINKESKENTENTNNRDQSEEGGITKTNQPKELTRFIIKEEEYFAFQELSRILENNGSNEKLRNAILENNEGISLKSQGIRDALRLFNDEQMKKFMGSGSTTVFIKKEHSVILCKKKINSPQTYTLEIIEQNGEKIIISILKKNEKISLYDSAIKYIRKKKIEIIQIPSSQESSVPRPEISPIGSQNLGKISPQNSTPKVDQQSSLIDSQNLENSFDLFKLNWSQEANKDIDPINHNQIGSQNHKESFMHFSSIDLGRLVPSPTESQIRGNFYNKSLENSPKADQQASPIDSQNLENSFDLFKLNWSQEANKDIDPINHNQIGSQNYKESFMDSSPESQNQEDHCFQDSFSINWSQNLGSKNSPNKMDLSFKENQKASPSESKALDKKDDENEQFTRSFFDFD